MSDPDEIIEFWFGREPRTPEELNTLILRWGPALDEEIRERFGAVIEQALCGACDGWEETRHGTLALILVLDQFPRHAFRGTARQYAGDAWALKLALAAWDEGWPRSLSTLRKIFFVLPLAHSERLEHQVLHVELAAEVSRTAPPWYGDVAQIPISQARKYHDLIARFGRFPHRNAMLDRESTTAEREWLESGGPARMPPDFVQRLLAERAASAPRS